MLVAVAAALRFWNLGAVGLTHFDEGTYALAARWLATLGREGAPYNAILSPPLFPALEGLAFLALGVRDSAAIAVSAAAGSLTVGLLYVVGRSWFGPAVGAAAAALLASAEYHVVFSRLALTDATFTLLFWGALACAFAALRDGRRRWYVLAGVLTGLAWNTKYNGFMPIAIAAAWAAIARYEFATPTGTPRPKGAASGIALAASIAVALYLPWAAIVQVQSGYGALLRWHADHSVGAGIFPTTPSTLWFYFSRWLSPALLVAAGAGIARIVLRRTEAGTFLLMTFAVFLVAAMFYMSFPRLVLPLAPAVCLFAAIGLETFARATTSRRRGAATAVVTAIVVAWSLPGSMKTLWTTTDAYRQAASYLRQAGVPVISQTSKCFYFYEDIPSHEVRFSDAARLDALLAASPEVLVAVDPIVERLPEANAWLERTCAGLTPERVFPISMYEPVYYQGFAPARTFEGVPRSVAPFVPGESEIRIYRVSRR
jgi:4-amino-4-deoxy-L-arabinose transferase-like glycosyltransferase